MSACVCKFMHNLSKQWISLPSTAPLDKAKRHYHDEIEFRSSQNAFYIGAGKDQQAMIERGWRSSRNNKNTRNFSQSILGQKCFFPTFCRSTWTIACSSVLQEINKLSEKGMIWVEKNLLNLLIAMLRERSQMARSSVTKLLTKSVSNVPVKICF